MLEPYDGKLSRTVLRGERSRKAPDLPGPDRIMNTEHDKTWSDLHGQARALSDSLYPTIGEFAVAFEALCHALRMGIGIILEANGLKRGRLADILVGDLTIFPLQTIYRALLAEAQEFDATEIKVLDNTFKRIAQLGEHRNKIIHSAWFIDFKNPEDIREGLLTRHRPGATKRGAKKDPCKFPITEIKEITENARVLDDLVHQLNMCIYTNRSICSRFRLDSDGEAVATGSIMDFFQKGKEG